MADPPIRQQVMKYLAAQFPCATLADHQLGADGLLAIFEAEAARVRAEAGNVFSNALTLGARPSQVIIVGARMTEDVLNTVRVVEEAFATAVRAEAVADVEQRLAVIRVLAEAAKASVPHAPYTGVSWQRLLEVLDAPTAGSVPVATPPTLEVASIPLDELPDWTDLAEAAGATLQNYEIGCSGEYETVMHWPDGRRAGNRDRLAIISEDAEMGQFATGVAGPVATPTEPAPSCAHRRLCAYPQCRHTDSRHWPQRPAASPVPAEPARERLSGWFDVTEVPAEQPPPPEGWPS